MHPLLYLCTNRCMVHCSGMYIKILKRLNSAQTRRSIAQTTIDDSDYEIQLAHEDLLDAKEMLQKVQQWLKLYFPD